MNGFSNNFCNVNTNGFPSPCGVWVVSTQICDRLNAVKVSVPLRGVGCFMAMCAYALDDVFPSPCGVWVVSLMPELVNSAAEFPSPCGVWVVSARTRQQTGPGVSVPLRGVGCFLFAAPLSAALTGFRPLAGCGLFPG